MLDPKMRKSTEFPVWLNKPETKAKLQGKQVLMYCTGGVRCERAGALLKQQLATEADNLGVSGVFQLQGGIHKYLDERPDGGYWIGKNYVFDKRFAHGAADKEEQESVECLSSCEGCRKPWDKFRGKRRCPTCGVPSLICKTCQDRDADKEDSFSLGKEVRCALCVEEGVSSIREMKERERWELEHYEKTHKPMPFEVEQRAREAAAEKVGGAAPPQKIQEKLAVGSSTDRSDPFPLTSKVLFWVGWFMLTCAPWQGPHFHDLRACH